MSIVLFSSSSTCLHSTNIQSYRHESNPNHRTQINLPFPSTYLKNRISHLTISRDHHMTIYSGEGFGSPPETPWALWVAGVLISAILTIWKTKNNWGPLLMFKQKVDDVVDVVEEVVEMVETAAEGVDKVAEEVAEHLPEGSELQKAALFIENAAERIAKDADFAGDIIDKVQEVEDQVSSFFKQNRETKEEDDDKQKKKKKNDQIEALQKGSKEQPLK